MNREEWTSVLLALTEELKKIYKDHLKAVILYGSVAKGTASEDSDIDIMVMVDVAQSELRKYEDQLCDISTNFALEYFKVFSIVDVSYQEFEEWKDVSPFYRNVKNEGITLYAA